VIEFCEEKYRRSGKSPAETMVQTPVQMTGR
jgi:hypothetical protein